MRRQKKKRCSAVRRPRGHSQGACRRGACSLAFSVEVRPRRARIWQRGCAKVKPTAAPCRAATWRSSTVGSRVNMIDFLVMAGAVLVRNQVAVIIALSTLPALAAKAATATIPIVFGATDDPVKLGLVAFVAWPGNQPTGCTSSSLISRHKIWVFRSGPPPPLRVSDCWLIPTIRMPRPLRETWLRRGLRLLGRGAMSFRRAHARAIETAFATLVGNKVEGLVNFADPFFISRRLQLATLATRHLIPAGRQRARGTRKRAA